jgi:hypothetical protein
MFAASYTTEHHSVNAGSMGDKGISMAYYRGIILPKPADLMLRRRESAVSKHGRWLGLACAVLRDARTASKLAQTA